MLFRSRSQIVDLVQAATGWNTSLFEIMKMAERGVTLARLYNSREGFGREADTLPERCFQPLVGGATDGVKIDRAQFERMVDAYYDMWGWHPVSGEPRNGVLYELGLEWAAK